MASKRDWHDRNKAKLAAQARARYRQYPEKKREHHLRKNYGLSISAYDALVEAQNGLCAICGLPPTGYDGKLSVDHEHSTGRVRGLLCHACNHALGNLRDDPDRAIRAAEYLRGRHWKIQ